MTVTGKADSQQLTPAILTSQVIQIVTQIVAKEADHFGCQIVTVRKGRVVASVAVNVLYKTGVQRYSVQMLTERYSPLPVHEKILRVDKENAKHCYLTSSITISFFNDVFRVDSCESYATLDTPMGEKSGNENDRK